MQFLRDREASKKNSFLTLKKLKKNLSLLIDIKEIENSLYVINIHDRIYNVSSKKIYISKINIKKYNKYIT